jgi:predicted transcriptional regulator
MTSISPVQKIAMSCYVFCLSVKGTDKDAIIGLLTARSKAQRHEISEMYQKQESKVSLWNIASSEVIL